MNKEAFFAILQASKALKAGVQPSEMDEALEILSTMLDSRTPKGVPVEIPTKAKEGEWIPSGEAARMAKVTYQHIYMMARRGQAPFTKDNQQKKGNYTLIRRTAAEAFANSRRKKKPEDFQEESVSE